MTLSNTPGHAPESGVSTEEASTLPAATAVAIAPARRQQLTQLEQAVQQEVALLRAQCAKTETADWLASSIDWDLSAL